MASERIVFAVLAATPLVAGHPTCKAQCGNYLLPLSGSLTDKSFENIGSRDSSAYSEFTPSDSRVESVVCVPETFASNDKDKAMSSALKSYHLPLSTMSKYAASSLQGSSVLTVSTITSSFLTTTMGVSSANSPVPKNTQRPSAGQVAVQGETSPELFGISYAPYRATHECKSQEDIEKDMEQIAGKYSVVRVYGTDCKQVPKMYKAAKSAGMKLFFGIWEPSNVQNEANKIIAAVNGDWDVVHTVSVGNELVNNGLTSPTEIIQAVKLARHILRAAGFKGPVVIVDTFMAVLAHPELCEASDYCAFNAHPFFDSTTTASHAGSWLVKTIGHVRSALQTSRRVMITETGWPTKGMANGLAVPGLANQKLALDSIQTAFASSRGDVILFSAFDDLWKPKDGATFDAEQFWGIDGAVAQCDKQTR